MLYDEVDISLMLLLLCRRYSPLLLPPDTLIYDIAAPPLTFAEPHGYAAADFG